MKKTRIIIAGAVAGALVICLSGCGRKKVNLNDYLTMECDGFDTAGYVNAELDYDRIVSENREAFGLSESAGEMEEINVEVAVEEYINGSADKTSGLSNGDTLTFEWKVNETRLEELYPINIEFSNETLEVSGLSEGEKFDPFEGVKVTFTGVAPDGRVEDIKYDKGDLVYEITADKTRGLSNGDKITLTVTNSYTDDVEEYFRRNGKLVTDMTKEYTVEGLASYAMKLSDIPKESLDKMDKNAQDSFKAYTASNWIDGESLKGMKLLGNYFIYPKDKEESVDPHNYVYFVYEVTALNLDKNKEPFNYYYYSYYTDVMMLDDGTCSFDLTSMKVPEGSSISGIIFGEAFDTGNYYYKGYEDLDSLFNKQVTSKIDKYAYESTVK